MSGMRDRVRMLGGRVELFARPGGCTAVEGAIRMPTKRPTNQDWCLHGVPTQCVSDASRSCGVGNISQEHCE
jgi:hypothetical protein